MDGLATTIQWDIREIFLEFSLKKTVINKVLTNFNGLVKKCSVPMTPNLLSV